MDDLKKYESYVVVHNIAKRHNIGTLARSCTAFGVSELILVGRRDFNAFGSHGSTAHVRLRHFYSLSEAKSFLKVQLHLKEKSYVKKEEKAKWGIYFGLIMCTLFSLVYVLVFLRWVVRKMGLLRDVYGD